MVVYIDPNNKNIKLRQGDGGRIRIYGNIPWQDYDWAYLSVVDPRTNRLVIPELKEPARNVPVLYFTFTSEITNAIPAPCRPFTVYEYGLKFCTNDGIEDTVIPEVKVDEKTGDISFKAAPKFIVYPKTTEGMR
jgi:hypothetical protein